MVTLNLISVVNPVLDPFDEAFIGFSSKNKHADQLAGSVAWLEVVLTSDGHYFFSLHII